jgi:hypothetical protein
VLVATTGSNSELVPTAPIAPEPGQRRVVAMRLGPHPPGGGGHTRILSLPDLMPGDRLDVTAEIEVTTDATKRRDAVGTPYEYDPVVYARLLLSADPEATQLGDRALPLCETSSERVTHREHHRVIVFERAGILIPDAGLPWAAPSHVSLVLSAHHPSARDGDLLLLGENDPDGTVVGDRGRIQAIRLRPADQAPPSTVSEATALTEAIPVRKGERTVVYSLGLDDLEEGEQLVVQATMTTSAAQLGYPTRVSSRLFLATDPTQEEPGGEAAAVAALRGKVTERNGFNCLPEHGQCTTRKVGIAALRKTTQGRLFVNLVAVCADPFGGAVHGDALGVTGGGIEVARYPADRRG